jgi:hypothetical protein
MDDYVNALAVSGTDLYAGGAFTTAGATAVNSVARWGGSAWSALGSGLNGTVYALAVSGANFYAGGAFTTAGNLVSAYAAKANLGAAGGQFGSLAYSPTTGFRCIFSNATIGQPYRVQTSPSLAGSSWTDITNFNYVGPIVITDTSAPATTNRFYRAVTP